MSEATQITRRLSLAPDVDLGDLLGRNDDHLRTLESEFDVRIVARGHDVMLKGDERQVRRAERALTQLAELLRSGAPLRGGEVRAAVKMIADGRPLTPESTEQAMSRYATETAADYAESTQ